MNVKLQVERSVILVTFYNQPWLKDRFQMGDEAAVFRQVGCSAAQSYRDEDSGNPVSESTVNGGDLYGE
ncbi:hypothetical protein PZ00_14150 [Lacticaseibacillus rhamnosus]|nr:hypothetical protein PZ00_14150 [Lacticaseibacillus rhamnosus]